ncbi:MAG TPA: T9SS type A sorting domain-containing protein, partial [Anaerolineae bacterium]|nr:T9SS type A sorting domain-containing protein [Anaerolineae bacterium]
KIERASLQEPQFRELGRVTPGAFAQWGSNYAFTDVQILPNDTYRYRIVATDSRGQEFMSPEAVITIKETQGLLVFPNPVVGGSFLIFSEEPMRALRITDALGRTVYKANPNNTQWRVSTGSWQAGIYFVQAQMASGHKTTPVFIKP